MELSDSDEQTNQRRLSRGLLRLTSLDNDDRTYALGALVAAFGATLVIASYALGIYPEETPLALPATLSPVQTDLSIPFSLILIVLIGLGFAAGALMYSLFAGKHRWSRLLRVGLSLLVLMLPLSFLDFGDVFGAGSAQLARLHTLVIIAAIVSGLFALVLAWRVSPRRARWCAGLVTATFLFVALAFLFYGRVDETFGPVQLETDFIRLAMLPLASLTLYMTPLVALTGVIFFWQALAEARLFSREIGIGLADFARKRFHRLPALLLIAKATTLAVGYALAVAGRADEPWATSLRDGFLSWLLAALFALCAGWWLAQPHQRLLPAPSNRIALVYTTGFLLPFILAFLIALPSSALAGLGLEAIGLTLLTVELALVSIGEWWTIAFATLLIPLGLLFLRWRRFRYLAPIFLLSGVWALPILPAVLLPDSNLSVQYLTFDAALTLVLVILGILVWRGHLSRPLSSTLVLVLAVSSMIALTDWPIPAGQAVAVAALLLLLPLAYELLFDSEDLNEMAQRDGRRVVRVLALQAILMLIVAWSLALGLLAPDEQSWETVANKVFLPPLVALLVAADISRHDRAASRNSS